MRLSAVSGFSAGFVVPFHALNSAVTIFPESGLAVSPLASHVLNPATVIFVTPPIRSLPFPSEKPPM